MQCIDGQNIEIAYDVALNFGYIAFPQDISYCFIVCGKIMVYKLRSIEMAC